MKGREVPIPIPPPQSPLPLKPPNLYLGEQGQKQPEKRGLIFNTHIQGGKRGGGRGGGSERRRRRRRGEEEQEEEEEEEVELGGQPEGFLTPVISPNPTDLQSLLLA